MSSSASLVTCRTAFPMTHSDTVSLSRDALASLPRPAVEAMHQLTTHLAQHGGVEW